MDFTRSGAPLDALFYPTLSLPGAAWTNPNLLFFDKIGVIAPEGDSRQLFDGPTRVLMEHELVEPVDPTRYAQDDHGDEQVFSYLLGLSHSPRKKQREVRIHLGKLAYTRLTDRLLRHGMLWRAHDPNWLEGPEWIVNYLMSVIAARMSSHPRLDVPLLTNLDDARRLMAGVPLAEKTIGARRMRAVSRLLPVGPDADITQIVRFRSQHRDELIAFRGLIEGLLRRSQAVPEGERDFEARLARAEELRRHLVGELAVVRSIAPPLTIALSITAIAAPVIEASYYSAAVAFGGLGYLLASHTAAARRDRTARRDKLVYAALASRAFAVHRADDLLG